MQSFGKSMPLDANGVPLAQDAYYVVKVPQKFARNFRHFDNVVIKSENIDPVNRVVRLDGVSADKWIRTNWLHRVNLTPVLSLEREKLAGEAVIALAKGLDTKALNAVAGNSPRNSPRRLRKVGVALAAAALLVCAGSFLKGFLGNHGSIPAVETTVVEGQPPAPILVGFVQKQ